MVDIVSHRETRDCRHWLLDRRVCLMSRVRINMRGLILLKYVWRCVTMHVGSNPVIVWVDIVLLRVRRRWHLRLGCGIERQEKVAREGGRPRRPVRSGRAHEFLSIH